MNDIETVRQQLETGRDIVVSEFETGRNSREKIERSWQPAFEALDRLETALRTAHGMLPYWSSEAQVLRRVLDPTTEEART